MSDTDTIAAEAPTHLRIEQRAYEIWIAEGRPTGCELDHWLRAETEVAPTVSEPEQEPAGGSGSKKKA